MNVLHIALSALSREELAEVIRNRPDATFPTPTSLGILASRLSAPASISRALRRLNAADIAVLEALGDAGAELTPVALTSLSLPFDGHDAITHLRAHGLVIGPDDALQVAPAVLSTLPAGWRIMDPAPDNLAEVLQGVSPREHRILDTLAASGSVGTTNAAALDADPDLPVPRLIEKGLLVRVDSNTVRLPRPVREALRGGTARTYPLSPSPLADAAEQNAVISAATAAGLDAVRRMRQLMTTLARKPVELNRDGSVGVRARAALDKALGFDPDLSVTIGESTGLIGRGPAEDAEVLALTRQGLAWLDMPLAQQWSALATGWLSSPWRTDTHEKLLGETTRDTHLRSVRVGVVTLFQRGTLQRSSVSADLHHFFPLLASGTSPALIDAIIDEAHLIGVLAHNSATPLLSAFLAHDDMAAAAAALVPEEVSYVIAQADMTVLAPGPLSPEMTTMLESFAQLDSPGVASLYRVSEDTVRAALSAGHSAIELKDWLTTHSAGEVPQAMTFLIDDVARRDGTLRVGATMSYLRSEDPALITSAAAHVTQLRVLAPTVAVADVSREELLRLLQSAGFQPAAEDATGATLSSAFAPVLVPATVSASPKTGEANEDHVQKVLAALEDSTIDEAEDGSFVSTLQAAARSRRHVTLGYVDTSGRSRELTALPLSVTAGQVDALDESSERIVRISLPRITKVMLN